MSELWFPLLVIGLSWVEGFTEYRAWSVLGTAPKKMAAVNIWIILSVTMLNLLWFYIPMPVTLYYILYYLIRMLHFSGKKARLAQELFFINLGYVNYLVLHLIIIGILALVQHTSMSELLDIPFWRMLSVSVCTIVNTAETAAVLRWKSFSDSLNAEAESEEGRLLMAFLKFSTVYLLLDSLLCLSGSEPVYTALFLIGGCIILVSVLILYLWYIGKLLQSSRVRAENEILEAELEFQDCNTGTLRQMTERDAMTGAYSRRYGIRQMESLLKSGQEVSMVFLDLDHLKIVNDREGHEAGDRYLIGFVETLSRHLGEKGLIARLGGDEFMILLPGCPLSAAKPCMENIRNAMEEGGQGFFFSFGISYCPAGGQGNVENMIREADLGMYQDKGRRR